MMQEKASVVAVDGDRIEVEVAIKTTCNGCQVNQDCGTGVVARAMNPKSQRFWLSCSQPAQLHQIAVIGIPEARLLTASAMIYLLPLAVMMLCVLILQNWLSEPVLILTSIAAAVLSYVPIRAFFRRYEDNYQPQLLRLEPVPIETPVKQHLAGE